MWALLRKRALGVKFRRQHPIGPFVVDFFCAELGLVLELDGSVHRESVEADQRRDDALLSRGLIVLRFRNTDVLDSPGRTLTLLASVIAPLVPAANRRALASFTGDARSSSRRDADATTRADAPPARPPSPAPSRELIVALISSRGLNWCEQREVTTLR